MKKKKRTRRRIKINNKKKKKKVKRQTFVHIFPVGGILRVVCGGFKLKLTLVQQQGLKVLLEERKKKREREEWKW